MKTAILSIILVLLISSPVFSEAEYIYISPLPGEGPVQMAERNHVDATEFIRLNKKLGKFVNPKKPSLVYTWQKFALPDGRSANQKKPSVKGQAEIKNGVNFLEKAKKTELPILQESAIKTDAVEIEKAQLLPVKSSEEGESNLFLWAALSCVASLIVCLSMFGFGMTVNIKNDELKKHSFFEKYAIVFSDRLSCYCIIPNDDNSSSDMGVKKTLEELAREAVELSINQIKSNYLAIFTYKVNSKKKGGSPWRTLDEKEKKLFNEEVLKLINTRLKDG